jgi:hypothetical protein
MNESVLRICGTGDFVDIVDSILRSIGRVEHEMRIIKQKCE